mgnify:FL=1
MTLTLLVGCSQSEEYSTSDNVVIDEVVTKVVTDEVINGYLLPPEPDPESNNETLLGVDSNENGVRDDVERWIIKKYQDKHKIVTEIGLQGARAAQIIIQEPEKARETMVYFDRAVDCEMYFELVSDTKFVDTPIIGKEFDEIQFNTALRARAYGLYNATLSGGVYDTPTTTEWLNGCDFNVIKILEES